MFVRFGCNFKIVKFLNFYWKSGSFKVKRLIEVGGIRFIYRNKLNKNDKENKTNKKQRKLDE